MSKQNGLKGLQMVQFECPRHSNPSVSSILRKGKFSQLPLLALWGNKNWLPSMKVKKSEKFQNKMGLKECKWSSLNIPGTETLLSHPILKLDEPPLPLLALWGNKNWPPSMKVKKLKIFWDKMGSKGCKWSSLNAQGTGNPLPHPVLELKNLPFPNIGPLG